MENEKYPEFNKENEEAVMNNQVHEKFDVDEYEETCKRYKIGFFVSLIATILVFIVDVASLVMILSSGDKFNGADFALTIGLLVLDIIGVVFTVRCYDRWKEYE